MSRALFISGPHRQNRRYDIRIPKKFFKLLCSFGSAASGQGFGFLLVLVALRATNTPAPEPYATLPRLRRRRVRRALTKAPSARENQNPHTTDYPMTFPSNLDMCLHCGTMYHMPTKTEILKVRMPADMMEQARALAEKEDVPLSQIIRRLLKEKLDEEASKPQDLPSKSRRKEDQKS